MVAQTYPVYEQRYASDPFNPMKLYDCLVPQLSKYIRVPTLLYPHTHIEDIKMRIDLKHIEEATVSNLNSGPLSRQHPTRRIPDFVLCHLCQFKHENKYLNMEVVRQKVQIERYKEDLEVI